MLVTALALLLFGERLAGAAGLAARPDPGVQAAVESAFASAEGEDVVVLADVTEFEWDAVGVFSPYYPHDAIVEEMQVPVERTATNNLVNFEGYCLLIFRDADRVVGWTTVRRDVAECSFEDAGVYAPDEARFVADALRPVSPAAAHD